MIGLVYFIGSPAMDCVKIGLTRSDSVNSRLESIQTSFPYKLECFATIKCASGLDPLVVEKALHKCFQKSRMSGEWFKKDVEVLFLIEQVAKMERDGTNWATIKSNPFAGTEIDNLLSSCTKGKFTPEIHVEMLRKIIRKLMIDNIRCHESLSQSAKALEHVLGRVNDAVEIGFDAERSHHIQCWKKGLVTAEDFLIHNPEAALLSQEEVEELIKATASGFDYSSDAGAMEHNYSTP